MVGSITFDSSVTGDNSDKRRKKNDHILGIIRTGSKKTVTVEGSPGPPPKLGIPTSQSGIMVPYAIGRQRVFKPNAIWYGNVDLKYDTETTTIEREVQEIVDGELVFSTATSVQEDQYISGYTLDVHLALCLGPGVRLREIYIDGAKKWEGLASGARTVISSSSISDFDFWADFVFYDGRFDQTFASGAEVVGVTPPGYVGISILSLSGANASNIFPMISAEIERHPNPLLLDADVNVDAEGDINPMTAAFDVITNSWGGSGVQTTAVDEVSFTAAAVRLAEEGNFISIYNQELTTTGNILKEIENQCRCKFYQDPEDDVIKVQLIRWDLYDFDTALVLDESNSSAVRDFSKSSWADASTRSVASFTSREKDYDQDLLVALSPMVSGSLREEDTASYSYPLSMTAEVASKCLARDMIVLNQPSWSGELQVNRQGADLKPGQCVMVTSAEYNVTRIPCIVQFVRDITNDVGILVGFDELINPTSNVLYAVPEPSLFVPIDKDPVSPTDALVVSAPYWVQVWAGYDERIWNKRIKICTPIYLMEPYNRIQRSFDVRLLNYPDLDDMDVGEAPAINREVLYASVGQLVSGMAETDGWVNGIIATLNINGVTRPQYIKPTGLAGIREGSIWAFIDDEILSFEVAENVGGGVWTLTNVHRGLLDTAPAAHSAGAKVWIINGNWVDRIGMSFDIEPEYIPEFRFCSRTKDDRQVDEGLLYSDWTPDGRVNKPLRPQDTQIDGSRGTGSAVTVVRSSDYTISWKTRSRNKIKKVALFADAAHDPEVANNGTWQTHNVWLTDSAATDHDLGATTASPADPNSLDVTIPGGAALGAGYIWVQAEGAFGVAIQAERFAVNVT